MPSFLEPDPILLAFFAIKQGIYLEGLILFAALRTLLAQDTARRCAAIALFLSAIFVASKWVPPVIGLSQGPVFLLGGWVRTSLGGMSAPLICSGLLIAAAFVRGRRYWGLDLLHGLAFAGLIGLWIYTFVG